MRFDGRLCQSGSRGSLVLFFPACSYFVHLYVSDGLEKLYKPINSVKNQIFRENSRAWGIEQKIYKRAQNYQKANVRVVENSLCIKNDVWKLEVYVGLKETASVQFIVRGCMHAC